MSVSTHDVSQNASHTAEKTRNCHQQAMSGNQTVQNTVEQIHTLGAEIEQASASIAELKDKSEHINSVLDVIKEIAEQTNLLALNAAIEAARAGEQGRGFAVVADEVRGLAQRTQDSTEEISHIITDLQTSSQNSSQRMTATRHTVEQTIVESGRANQALEDIIKDISVINDMNIQVASATEQQNAVASEISTKVTAINDITSSVADNAHHVGALSQQLDTLSSGIRQNLSAFKL